MIAAQGSLFEVMPNVQVTPHAHRAAPRAPKLVKAPSQTAREAIGTITPGCRVIGFTKGQFSLIDLLRAVLEQTGPAHLTVSTCACRRGSSRSGPARVAPAARSARHAGRAAVGCAGGPTRGWGVWVVLTGGRVGV